MKPNQTALPAKANKRESCSKRNALIIVAIFLAGCAGRSANVGSQPSPDEAFSQLKSCLPPSEPESALQLTIVSVVSGPDDTKVRLVARAVNEAVDFDLPVYRLSYGRWMINEKGRAYLIDERCREYRLKDRKSASGEKIPPSGRIRLKPGQAFETILIFPGLIGHPQRGGLIYGGRTLPFMFGAQS